MTTTRGSIVIESSWLMTDCCKRSYRCSNLWRRLALVRGGLWIRFPPPARFPPTAAAAPEAAGRRQCLTPAEAAEGGWLLLRGVEPLCSAGLVGYAPPAPEIPRSPPNVRHIHRPNGDADASSAIGIGWEEATMFVCLLLRPVSRSSVS